MEEIAIAMRTIPGNPGRLSKESRAMQGFYKVMSRLPSTPSMGRYNLTISHESKFIWFRVGKVGTRTIFNRLKESGIHLDVKNSNFIHYPPNLFEEYFKFAFVRNPWDRLVSCWHNKVIDANHFRFNDSQYENMQNFENFVNFVSKRNIAKCDRHFRLQAALIDLNNIDFIGRMESFCDDVNFVFKRLGLSEMEIVAKNVTSSRKPYPDYYNADLAEKVAQIYRKDIQIFGYKF